MFIILFDRNWIVKSQQTVRRGQTGPRENWCLPCWGLPVHTRHFFLRFVVGIFTEFSHCVFCVNSSDSMLNGTIVSEPRDFFHTWHADCHAQSHVVVLRTSSNINALGTLFEIGEHRMWRQIEVWSHNKKSQCHVHVPDNVKTILGLNLIRKQPRERGAAQM